MRRSVAHLTMLTLCAFSGARLLLAHSAGESCDDLVPPPLQIEMREAAPLTKDLGGAAYPTRCVVDDLMLWPGRRRRSGVYDTTTAKLMMDF
jgi:hypothetical protein